jgi:hypothetical protein
MGKSLIVSFIILTFVTFASFAQTVKDLKTSVAAINKMRESLPIEKLYLQTDKLYYYWGDTLHFKSYLLNADYLTPSDRSGLLYVELDDATGKSVKRLLVPTAAGMAWGDIVLDEKETQEGSYTLRSYTNWMRNFGEDYIFKKDIYILAVKNSTLVTSVFTQDSIAGKNKVNAGLQFTGIDKNV